MGACLPGAYDNFHRLGSLIIAHDSDKGDLLRFKQQLQHKPGHDDHSVQQLDREGIATLESELASRFEAGLVLPDESWLCARCTLNHLSEKLEAQGVRIHYGTKVESVDP